MKPQHYPITLAMAAAIVLNLAVVRFGGAALSETELVAVSVAVQACAGLVSQRFTRSRASVEESGGRDRPAASPRSDKGEPR